MEVRLYLYKNKLYTVVCKKNDNCLNWSNFLMSKLIKTYCITFESLKAVDFINVKVS